MADRNDPRGQLRIPTPIVPAMAALVIAAGPAVASAQWPQWGGPDRNFMVDTEGLADSWPDEGPPKLWHRELGDGYSTIIVDDGLLYTMYRLDEDEFSIALDARTGETVWEYRNWSPFTETMTQYGPGPHSTPIVAGDRVFTVGTNALPHCFDKKTGKVLWKRDLVAHFEAPLLNYGYGCSPIVYGNTIILSVGRTQEGQRGSRQLNKEAKKEANVRLR